jgi:restriction endonuclease S subunit
MENSSKEGFMSKQEEKRPSIRFKGYTEPWEQRKLGEVSEKVKEKNSDNLYSSVLTNSAEFGIIPQRDFFDKDIANEKSLNGYYIVKQDDFVYNPRISNHAPVGPIKRNQLNEVGVMSPLYYVFRTHDIENSYLATYFDATYWHKFMKLNGDSGARADRFAIKDSLFIEMPIPCPVLPEQVAIGSFFQELDQLITLQQRELELIKEGKKTLLSKMFPKDGENFPEIRFPGFTNAWEQRKLGAYLTVSKNRNVDGEYDKSDVLSVSGDYGIVNQIKFQGRSFAGASVLPYGIVETGDVVYTKSPLKANPYGIIKTNHGKNGIVSTLYAVYKVNNGSNGIFVEYYFDDNLRLNKYLKPLVNKGAKNDMKVTDENVLKGDVIFPSFPEQTAIGSFFQELDQLITLQQRELEMLKTMKSTLLKAMFA